MKITAGLGSVEDYPSFVSAGADECFCGYVPDWWTKEYGIFSPLNRREVLYYNVQIGSASEMEILHDMIQFYGIPVSITLNALYYSPEQYPLVERYIRECISLGFDSFIIADFALLIYLKHIGLNRDIQLTISGELSEMNTETLELLTDFQIKRLIFHRKMTPFEMKICSEKYREKLEFEAFALNEKCHFHGGFCNSLHCDELTHMCMVPYMLGSIKAGENARFSPTLSDHVDRNNLSESPLCDEGNEDFYIPGQTGCGLCALWALADAGITHLKLVGRGNYTEDMIRDIQALKQALQILKESHSETDYIRSMKNQLFSHGCSGNCYY